MSHPALPPTNTLRRRRALAALLGWPALASTPQVHAEDGRPIRLIVPFAPGGPTDIAARAIADALTKALGRAVVAENRPGAGGNIGAEAAARSAPDGHTLFWAQAATHGINPTLYAKLAYDVLADFAPVGLLVTEPLVIVAHPDFAANDVPGLIATAQAQPGGLSFGSGGHGSAPHLAGQWFGHLARAPLLHVPFKGNAPAVAEVMAGRIDIVFDGINSALGHLRSGKLKALGTTGRTRTPLLPQAAPVALTLPGYEVTSWGGIAAPAGTPSATIERLSNALGAIAAEPALRQRFAASGLQLQASTPAQMERFVREQIALWRPIVERGGSRLE